MTLCFKIQQSTNEGLVIQNNDLSDIKHKNDLSGFGIQSNDLSGTKSNEGPEQKQPTEALNFDWLKRNGNGHSVSRQAAQQRLKNKRKRLLSFLKNLGDTKTQKLVVHGLLVSKEFQEVSKPVLEEINLKGNLTKNANDCEEMTPDIALKFMKNVKLILKMLLTKKGKKSNDEERFARIIFTALCGNEADKNDCKALGHFLGIRTKSVNLRMKTGKANRNKILNNEKHGFRFFIQQMQKKQINEELTRLIVSWVLHHPHVRDSPNMNDTLLMPNGERVGKKLLQIPVTTLHNDLADSQIEGIRDDDGNLMVGHTSFCNLLKKELPMLKRATAKHLLRCACEVCLIMMKMQDSLNSFRKKLKELEVEMKVKERRVVAYKGCFLVLQTQREKQLENSKKKHESYLKSCIIDETPRNEKPSQALAEIMCKPVNVGDKSHYPWACVLSKCNRCPKCVTHDIEKSVTTNDLVIFEHCVNTTRCNKHEGVIGYNLKEEDKVCGRCEEAAKAGKKLVR